MNDIQKSKQTLIKDLKKLRRENRDLKNLATLFSEIAAKSGPSEISWIYAIEGNRDGVWDWNAITNEVFFSKRWKEMLGYKENEINNDLSEWDNRLHPDDRDAVYVDLKRHLDGETPFYHNEHRLRCKDGSYKWILDRGKVIGWTKDGKPARVVGTHTDITERKEAEIENRRLMEQLREALNKIKMLNGLLPICASCKKIRDDKGYWTQIEKYISEHSEATFSHGICPECAKKLYPFLSIGKKKDNL